MTSTRVNKWLSFQLASLIFFNSIATGFVLLDFKLRQDFIAKVLCVNKEKPKRQCHGKCYLKKQLKQVTDQQSDENKATTQKVETQLLFCSAFSSPDWGTPIRRKKKRFPIFNDSRLATTSLEIFHPPRV